MLNTTRIQPIGKALWPRAGDNLQSLPGREPSTLRNLPQTTEIDRTVRQAMVAIPVIRLRIFTPDGVIVFSTDDTEIGRKSEEAGFKAARQRQAPTSILTSNVAERERSIRREDVDIIETYFPKVTAEGKVAVVYESYFDVTAAKDRIEADSTRAMLVSLLILFLVYFALHLIVARAVRALSRCVIPSSPWA